MNDNAINECAIDNDRIHNYNSALFNTYESTYAPPMPPPPHPTSFPVLPTHKTLSNHIYIFL